MNQIINGYEGFEGLISIIKRYLLSTNVDETIIDKLYVYLDLVSARASGHIPTPARAIRNFIMSNPLYQHDSKISQGLTYELLRNYDQF